MAEPPANDRKRPIVLAQLKIITLIPHQSCNVLRILFNLTFFRAKSVAEALQAINSQTKFIIDESLVDLAFSGKMNNI
jgi:hypothetical protein